MKKIMFILAIVFSLSFTAISFAEETYVTVGLKTWTATWEEKFTGGSIKSDYGFTYGPNINVKHGNFFGGLSYLTGGGFTFPEETFSDILGDYDVNYEADRTTMDLWFGYFFHPNIAGFAGYKSDELDFTFTSDTLGLTTDSKIKINGPVFGVYGLYPIKETRFVLFGNLSYMMLDSEIDGESTGDATGPSVEFGGAYSIQNMPLSISGGYKYQNFKTDDGEDTFSGITLGVNYTFGL